MTEMIRPRSAARPGERRGGDGDGAAPRVPRTARRRGAPLCCVLRYVAACSHRPSFRAALRSGWKGNKQKDRPRKKSHKGVFVYWVVLFFFFPSSFRRVVFLGCFEGFFLVFILFYEALGSVVRGPAGPPRSEPFAGGWGPILAARSDFGFRFPAARFLLPTPMLSDAAFSLLTNTRQLF